MTALRSLALLLAVLLAATGMARLGGDAKLKALVEGDQRAESHVKRDQYRHPYELLRFAGLKDDMTVLELAPGAGYWTEILAPYLKDKGRYIAVQIDPERVENPQSKSYLAANLQRFKDKLAADPANYAKTEIAFLNYEGIVPDGTADFALLARNMHDFMGAHGGPDTIDALIAALFKALKPGGVLVIEDHRGDAAKAQDPKAVSGYIREDYAIALVEKAGFRLAGKSELLANPKDTKDYPGGVFFLPPGERGAGGEPLSAEDKARAEAIGESDRFLLKFEKPKA
jgi:predicted methyltransferase